jgi:O104-antigen biosynthesis beta-1,3-galactosyltransferase
MTHCRSVDALSVLMPVYHRESPAFLAESLASLAGQTVLADEVVIVKDGPLGDALEQVIASFQTKLRIRPVALERHMGLGIALQRGVRECKNDLIARMDSDDICVPDRLEKERDFMVAHPEIDVLGGSIAEFEVDPAKPQCVRNLPAGGPNLLRWAKHRNPFNHMTVMFRKNAVLRAGSYQAMKGFEDYYLWARMMMAGSCIANHQDILAYARCGNGLQGRRGGLGYAREEVRFQFTLLSIGFLGFRECAVNLLLRTPLRLVPESLRAYFYRSFLRTKVASPDESAGVKPEL